jgi:IS5 family transposase
MPRRDLGVDIVTVVGAIAGEGRHRTINPVEQGADLRAIVGVLVGQHRRADPPGVGVGGEVERPPGSAPLGAMLLQSRSPPPTPWRPAGSSSSAPAPCPATPCDGHTLAEQIARTERVTGVGIERAYVDRGHRGHGADRARVILSGQKRGVTPTIRRERRRRSAIEPVIGHMKSDGHLGRNFLLGAGGDAANLILAAAGHDLRLLRAWLAWLLVFLLSLAVAVHNCRPATRLRPSVV